MLNTVEKNYFSKTTLPWTLPTRATAYGLYYCYFERIGKEELGEEVKKKVDYYPCYTGFIPPSYMTESEMFLVLSYLFEKTARDNDTKVNEFATVCYVEEKLAKYDFSLIYEAKKRGYKIKPLYVLDGHIEDASELPLDPSGKSWYVQGVKRDLIENIYAHSGRTLDEIEGVSRNRSC